MNKTLVSYLHRIAHDNVISGGTVIIDKMSDKELLQWIKEKSIRDDFFVITFMKDLDAL